MAALTALGLYPSLTGSTIRFGRRESYDITTGKMDLHYSRTTNEIKRAYSAEAVKKAARQFGWKLTEEDQRHYTAVKR